MPDTISVRISSDGETLVVEHERDKESMPWPDGLADLAALLINPVRHASGIGTAAPEGQPGTYEVPASRKSTEGKMWLMNADLFTQAEFLSLDLGKIFGSEIKSKVRKARDEERLVRLEVVCDPNDVSMMIPWELADFGDRGGALLLALEQGCSIVRRAPTNTLNTNPTPPVPRPGELAAQVLNLAPQGQLVSIVRAFNGAFDNACPYVNGIAGIERELDVLFVVGHGQAAVSGENSEANPSIGGVVSEEISDHFKDQPWPELIVLVSCQTAESTAHSLSFAGELVKSGAPAVVGMAGDIEADRVAPAFVKGLWNALQRGASAEGAVQAGRVAVSTVPGQIAAWQWALPVLHTSTDNLLPAARGWTGVAGIDELRSAVILHKAKIRGNVHIVEKENVVVSETVIEGDFTVGS